MKCLTVKQASELFFAGNVSQSFIYKEIRTGKLPHVKLSKGKILLDAEALEVWWNGLITSDHQNPDTCSGLAEQCNSERRT